MNFLLSVSQNQDTNFVEIITFGAQMLLIGMLAVFAVLGIIYAVLTVFKLVFTAQKTPAVQQKSEAAPVAAPVVTTSNDAEIVAVIAAAIAMAEAESGNGEKFRVVSFRRK